MPNLDGPRRRVNSLMDDACVITKDPLRLSDATVDPVTLALTPNTTNDTAIYTGKCFITKDNRLGSQNDTETGSSIIGVSYSIAIPWATKVLRRGYQVLVTKAADPALKNQRFTISDVDMGTLLVWRRASMVLIESDRDT